MMKRFSKNQDVIYDVDRYRPDIQKLFEQVEVKIAEDGSVAGLVFPESKVQQTFDNYLSGRAASKPVTAKGNNTKMLNKWISSTGIVQAMVEESSLGSKNVDFLSFSLNADPTFKFMVSITGLFLTSCILPPPRWLSSNR